MIQQSLNTFFSVISAEAERNPTFGANLQAAIVKMAEQIDRSQVEQRKIKSFNPFQSFKDGGREGMTKALDKQFKADELRVMVRLHNADPSGSLPNRARKADLIETMVVMAENRAKRDAKLFNY